MNKTAVLITGNPKYINHVKWRVKSEVFYKRIESILKGCGYTVTRDPGEYYTLPITADLWVAHSRGISRLRFAPAGVDTVAIDDYLPKGHYDLNTGDPNNKHFEVTKELEDILRSKTRCNKTEINLKEQKQLDAKEVRSRRIKTCF